MILTNLIRGSFLSILIIVLNSCGSNSNDPQPSCEDPPVLAVTATVPASSCTASDGEVSVSVTQGGEAPFTFTLGNTSNESGQFQGLQSGTYLIKVEDVNGCSAQIEASVGAPETDLSASATATADTECFSDNGSIELVATGGEEPYQYNIGNGFTSENTFTGLEPGNYSITVKDGAGCTISISASVQAGDTGTSFQAEIEPIFEANCILSNCHNGDLGASLDFSKLENIQANASQVKSRTQSGDMPRGGLTLTEEEKALIACWVDEGAKNN